MNQPDGFDCPGCAWPDRNPHSTFEFCENGAKAVAEEATKRVVTREFFARHTVAELQAQPEYWLSQQGRLTEPMVLRAGDELALDTPGWGLRNYIAVRGGIDVEPVLGSRSTDTLSGLGPPPLGTDDRLPVGHAAGDWPTALSAPADRDHPRVVVLECHEGPRAGHLESPSDLFVGTWLVGSDSNRVGVRIDRAEGSAQPLLAHRAGAAELRSEGIAHGSVQVPPSGRPVIFLADHPVTGGYPVVAVLAAGAVDLAAQLVPGSEIRFRQC